MTTITLTNDQRLSLLLALGVATDKYKERCEKIKSITVDSTGKELDFWRSEIAEHESKIADWEELRLLVAAG